MYEKAKFVCLYLMRPQKMKFESVQINMKHVLYVNKPDARKPLDFNLLRISPKFLIVRNKSLPFLS